MQLNSFDFYTFMKNTVHSTEDLNCCFAVDSSTKGQYISTDHCSHINHPSIPHCKSQNYISCLLKKSPAYGWKVCALKTDMQTGEIDQTPRLGLMCVNRGENDSLMLMI